ncbi:MAG: hypothetical protein AB7F40_04315 [Victivallaceae bacterium]
MNYHDFCGVSVSVSSKSLSDFTPAFRKPEQSPKPRVLSKRHPKFSDFSDYEITRGVELMISPDDLKIREVGIALFDVFGYTPEEVFAQITKNEPLSEGPMFDFGENAGVVRLKKDGTRCPVPVPNEWQSINVKELRRVCGARMIDGLSPRDFNNVIKIDLVNRLVKNGYTPENVKALSGSIQVVRRRSHRRSSNHSTRRPV